MSKTAEKIKYYYDKGIYKKKHIDIFLENGNITQEEYNWILGIEDGETDE